MSDRTRGRLAGLAAALGLLAVTLVFFWKIAFTNRVLVGLDVFTYFYPYREYASAALAAGRLPLWNPYLFMGAPLLANSQVAVLYPPNWALIGLAAPKQVAWSIVLHVWLAGLGTYLFARRAMGLGRLPALAAALVLALGGFIGAQVEHVNQLNASAWLPWLLLAVEAAAGTGRRRWPALLGGGAVVAMMVLAGHTQAAYIGLFGAAAYALLRDAGRPLRLRRFRRVAVLAAMGVMGLALSAAQLLPTLELSRLSVRGGGLDYREAVSFSLKPALIFKAFLPPFAWEPPFSEYVAYVGLSGLALAALGAGALWRARRRGPAAGEGAARPGWVAVALAGLGVFLALGVYNPVYYVLYRLVPGFSLFRVPARWLLLYTLGAALLAGAGVQALGRRRAWQMIALLLLAAELFAAGRRLAYNQPTAPAAYGSLRSAPAHLLAHQAEEVVGPRFLSLSDIQFDPGDLGDLQAMYGPALPEQAVYDLIVATKMKEVLAYNLPLLYRLASVDGYDGGLLPLARYVTLERLFLREDQIWPDGRLRQQLRAIPPARLLSMLNVEYAITDKTQDAWIDGVYYDLEHTVSLGEVTVTDVPTLTCTELGVVSYLTGTVDVPDGAPVALLTVADQNGAVVTATLRAGRDTAEGLYSVQPAAHRQARVGHTWRDDPRGSDYVTRVELGRALQPAAVTVRSLLAPGAEVRLRGLTLIDGRTAAFRSVTVDPSYQLVHSGDVKIYRNLDVLPRARVVYRTRAAEDDEAALSALRDPAFDPAREAIVTGGPALAGSGGGTAASIVVYEAERVEIEATLAEPGLLVIADTDYPGWTAEVDGVPSTIVTANLYFRGIRLTAGRHTVVLAYRPAGARLGLIISLAAWLALAAALAGAVLLPRIGRRRGSDV